MAVTPSVAAVAAGILGAWATTAYVAREIKKTAIENDIHLGHNSKRDFDTIRNLHNEEKVGMVGSEDKRPSDIDMEEAEHKPEHHH